MRIPKRYGQSRVDSCPFCGNRGITSNSQGIPVCLEHKKTLLPDRKCLCGEWLDLKKGKFGPFFTCMKCGCISFNKGLEMNPDYKEKAEGKAEPAKKSEAFASSYQPKRQAQTKPTYKAISETKKEVTISSDELDFYY